MRWVLLVVSIALALAVGELAARALVDDVYLQRGLRAGGVLVPYEPGARADLLTDEFRVHYAINRFGHRDRLDRREERTPGVPRIVLLGDSFAAGWGVEFEETFGYLLEEATGIEVVNAAKNGGCPLWSVPQARVLRERFHPDWLLVQLFDNDPADDAHYRKRFRIEIGERFRELPEELLPPRSLHERAAYVFDRLVLRRRLRALVRRLRGDEVHRSPYVRPGARARARILSRDEAIAAHGVDLSPDAPWEGDFAIHDPAQQEAWRERIAWNSRLLEQLLEEAQPSGMRVAFLYIPAYPVFLRERTRNSFAEASRAVARRHGATWLDAREIFAGVDRPWELYHAWDGHLNAAGHAALARGLERELAPRATEPRAPL